MTFQELDVIKSRTLLLSLNEQSPEVVLVDPAEGDMYFIFRLQLVAQGSEVTSKVTVVDPHHCTITIDIVDNALIEPSEPIPLGTYGASHKSLYLGFTVKPQMGVPGRYDFTVTFYTRKEVVE